MANLSPVPGYYRFDSASRSNCHQGTVDHSLAKVLLMCGRFALRCSLHQLVDQFLLASNPDLSLKPRFNIAPTQTIIALRRPAGSPDRELASFHWGLIPSWAKDPAVGNRMINARSETVAEKPSFRAAFKTRRCLVLTDGYYEWQQRGSRKHPYFFHRNDDQPFAFAGLWERWLDPQSGNSKETATILTAAANEKIAPFHHRMPVILKPENYDSWLDPELSDRSVLDPLLTTQPPKALIIDPVSTLVNSPRNDDPRCLEPPRELF